MSAAEQYVEQARFNMIEQQIRPWDVADQRVLDTMAAVPREKFVPKAYQALAFADIEVPLSQGQHMMFPRIEARMLQALNPSTTDKALEIGTGSGYITACLARLGGGIDSIEINTDLSNAAGERLANLGIANVKLIVGDVFKDAIPADGRYDVIAVTGSVPDIHTVQTWAERLSPGGRLFAVVGESPVMEALLITRQGDHGFRTEVLFETDLAPLKGFTTEAKFEL